MPPGLINRLVEARFPGVYWNPQRWPTADGYIPFKMFDLYVGALEPTLALDRMNMAQAIGMVMAEEQTAERMRLAAIREAYPEEG